MRGRPKLMIDRDEFEKLCRLQFSAGEMARFFGCSADTLSRWCWQTYHRPFNQVFSRKRKAGFVDLRHAQWRLARTSPEMAMFLGRVYLGQRETREVKCNLNSRAAMKVLLMECAAMDDILGPGASPALVIRTEDVPATQGVSEKL